MHCRMADQSDHPGDNGAHEAGIEKQLCRRLQARIVKHLLIWLLGVLKCLLLTKCIFKIIAQDPKSPDIAAKSHILAAKRCCLIAK